MSVPLHTYEELAVLARVATAGATLQAVNGRQPRSEITDESESLSWHAVEYW